MKSLEFTAIKLQKKSLADNFAGLIACAVLLVGYTKVFLSAFPSVFQNWWVYAILCIGIAALLIFLNGWKYKNKCIVLAIITVVAIVFLNISQFINGICILLNDFLVFLTGKTGNVYLDFPVNTDAGKIFATTIAMIGVTAVLVWAVCKKNLSVTLLLLLMCIAGCICDLFSADYGVAITFFGTILFWVYKNCKINRLLSYLFTNSTVVLTVLVCAFIGIGIGYLLRFDVSFDHKLNEIENAIHKIKYHTDDNAMPEGYLVDVPAFERSSDVALIVSAQTPQKFYLRGMIGEVYTGSSWEKFDSDIYIENEALFYWLHKLNFYGQSIISQTAQIIPEQQVNHLKITNVSACKEHAYIPYAVCNNGIFLPDSIADGTVYSDLTNLELEYYPGGLPQWYQMALWLSENQNSAEVKTYLQKEEAYREFVYKNHLQLTNTAVGAFEQIFDNDMNQEKSLSEILKLVRKTVGEHIEYDETVITENGKNDFVSYTLQQSKKGYSTHYATVATLMLRYMGVPARYVEGYYISAEEAEKYKSYDDMIITEGQAHCWAEYYMDGVGWIPFEVTPGYIDQEEIDETSMVVADGNGSGAGKEFEQSRLKYTPPKIPENKNSLPDLRSMFRFRVKQVVAFAVILICVMLLFFVIWIIRRAVRLKRFFKNNSKKENNEAVVNLFGYASMLIDRFGLATKPDYIEACAVNEEARFSNHTINDQQRGLMEMFAKDIISQCKETHNVWQKIKYRFILWLY